MAVQICQECGEHNAICKRICMGCGAFLEGWTINNVTGKLGYRSADGRWTDVRDMGSDEEEG